mmetsp:Transcript_133183/g.371260  ORF Transcript_133183/g.371260 Transcript_133183/m.371260 type:complete len:923 (-) Transcript_133183:138-2906(-)
METGPAANLLAHANDKEVLVARVKEFQRSQPELKHKWWAFCAAQGKVDFDPNQHDAPFLQKFFDTLERDLTKDGGFVGRGPCSASNTRITEKIFVAGIPLENPNEEAIRRAFLPFGPIHNVEMKFDASGFRGFCFVTFESVDSARAALAHKGRVIVQGKAVDCKAAVPKEEMDSTSGWGGCDWSSWCGMDDMMAWPLCKGGMGCMDPMGCMMGCMGCGGFGAKGMGCWGGPGCGDMSSWQTLGKGAKGALGMGSNCSSCVLRMRGVPHEKNTEDEIWRFFKDFHVTKVLPKAGIDKDGKPKGEAYVEFSELSEASRALNTLQYAMMGSRYIELFNSTPEEMSMATKEKARNPAMADQPTTKCLRMRGLPFKATAEDICSFFSGFPVMTVVPSVFSRADGRPSGEAYVEFESVEKCLEAFQARQYSTMRQRYVELFPSSPQEMAVAMREGGAEAVDAAGLAAGKGGAAGQEPAKVFVGALPRTATEAAVRAHFESFGPVEKVQMQLAEDGTSKGFCFVVFRDLAAAEAVLGNYDHNTFEGQWIACKPAITRSAKGKGEGKDGKGAWASDWSGGGTSGWSNDVGSSGWGDSGGGSGWGCDGGGSGCRGNEGGGAGWGTTGGGSGWSAEGSGTGWGSDTGSLGWGKDCGGSGWGKDGGGLGWGKDSGCSNWGADWSNWAGMPSGWGDWGNPGGMWNGASSLCKGMMSKGMPGKAMMGKGFMGKDMMMMKGMMGKGMMPKGMLAKGMMGKCMMGKGLMGKGPMGKGFMGKGIMGKEAMGGQAAMACTGGMCSWEPNSSSEWNVGAGQSDGSCMAICNGLPSDTGAGGSPYTMGGIMTGVADGMLGGGMTGPNGCPLGGSMPGFPGNMGDGMGGGGMEAAGAAVGSEGLGMGGMGCPGSGMGSWACGGGHGFGPMAAVPGAPRAAPY